MRVRRCIGRWMRFVFVVRIRLDVGIGCSVTPVSEAKSFYRDLALERSR